MTQTIPAISETDFQRNVIALAKLFGWLVVHFRPAQTKHGWRTPTQGDAGFVDLVLARKGRVIFAELKSETGKLSAHQQVWINELEIGPAECYVWRPSDLDSIGKLLGPGA